MRNSPCGITVPFRANATINKFRILTAKICGLVGRATMADPPSAGGAFSSLPARCYEKPRVLRDEAGHIPDLGTWGQQIAEFPLARSNDPWHGYPLWPLGEEGPENRKGEKGRPSKSVFLGMEALGLITHRERKKLYKGDHL